MICRHGELASHIVAEQKVASKAGANLARLLHESFRVRVTTDTGGE